MPRAAGRIGQRPGDLLPSLASLVPKFAQAHHRPASEAPWVKSAESFFETWQKVAPCMPRYQAFLAAHQAPGELGRGFLHDLKQTQRANRGKVMTDAAQSALGEFYLSVAARLRPGEVNAAGQDSDALLQVARRCAEEDFEPFVERARHLVADYNTSLHEALQATCPLYEVDDGLFWHANLEVAAASEFNHFLTALGHGSGQGWVAGAAHVAPAKVAKVVETCWEGLVGGEACFEPARRAATVTYDKWLEASSMPVKAAIAQVLMEHGLLIVQGVLHSEPLQPVIPALWPGHPGPAAVAQPADLAV